MSILSDSLLEHIGTNILRMACASDVRRVSVSYMGSKLALPIDENGNLSLALLKQYYPNAIGLTYTNINEIIGLNISDNNIIIPDLYVTYNVHTVDEPKTVTSQKEKRIQDIISQIRHKDCPPKPLAPAPASGKNIKSTKIDKVLRIGWLHKADRANTYSQMKKPLGGIKNIKLNGSTKYSAGDIKNLAQLKFITHGNSFLRSLTSHLGFYDGSIIHEFQNSNGDPCDLWEYCQSHGTALYKLTLYLLTSVQAEESIPNITMSNSIQINKSEQVQIHDELFTSLSEIDSNYNCVAQVRKQNSDTLMQTSQIEDDSSTPFVSNQNNPDDIRILFEHVKQSKYTESLSISHVEKDELYMCLPEDERHVVMDEFYPVDFGFRISELSKNGQVVLKNYLDENLCRQFTFPSIESSLIIEHKVLYDIDALNGTYGGKFGFGFIPTCRDTCKPMFTWYKDHEIYKRGEFMYWLSISKSDQSKPHTWSCEVKCSETDSPITSTVLILSENPINDNMSDIACTSAELGQLPVIDKNEIIFTKKILGIGMQGKVREGTWLGTTVAIKSIKLHNSNQKLSSREIELLGYIRHPNIIQTMAVCIEPKQLHIVMELINGHTLSDIIFDTDVRTEYNFNIPTKNKIAMQICRAINYLHLQSNPIIHRDIKPDNILVSLELIVKICDLGLSKFKHMASICSTIGSNTCKGTPMYMAPEIILRESEATVYSDIWATACTLVELYSEDSVWSLQDGDQLFLLKKKLMENAIPNIENIPIKLQDLLKRCFNRTDVERPMISEVLQILTSM